MSLVPGQGSATGDLRARAELEDKGLLHNSCKGFLSYTIPKNLWGNVKPSQRNSGGTLNHPKETLGRC